MQAGRVSIGALIVLAVLCGTADASTERVDLPVRGKTMALTVYVPAVPPSQIKGTILMGSGDVGWVGLATSMAEFLSADGYVVVGINVRQYLSVFRTRDSHLIAAEVPGDYGQIAAYLRGRNLLRPPVVVSGVSEGAAIAVLGASAQANHAWIDGVHRTRRLPRPVEQRIPYLAGTGIARADTHRRLLAGKAGSGEHAQHRPARLVRGG